MQKYGLKNVAEKKFVQLISSCIAQKNQLHRIRLFGRFLELYDDLSAVEYNKYLEVADMFTQQILNFKIEDDCDQILLPVVIQQLLLIFLVKGLGLLQNEVRIQVHASRLQSEIAARKPFMLMDQIDKMKIPVGIEESKSQKHLKGVREAVDYDQFLEFVLDNYIFLQDEREQTLKDIFLAVDVSDHEEIQ